MVILQLFPVLQYKARISTRAFLQNPLQNKYTISKQIQLLKTLDTNLIWWYFLKCQELCDTAMGIAPAYNIRIRDDINVQLSLQTFNHAYHPLWLLSLMSKTREMTFQVLNRTVWTNNKVFKSHMTGNSNHECCWLIETMQHLLSECKYY
jgi:hypothetical protein